MAASRAVVGCWKVVESWKDAHCFPKKIYAGWKSSVGRKRVVVGSPVGQKTRNSAVEKEVVLGERSNRGLPERVDDCFLEEDPPGEVFRPSGWPFAALEPSVALLDDDGETDHLRSGDAALPE